MAENAVQPNQKKPKRLGAVRLVLILVALALAGWFAHVAAKTPTHDRNWRAELAVLPEASLTDWRFILDRVRDWTYSTEQPTRLTYRPKGFRFNDLQRVWLMVEPHPGNDLVAHTLLLFEFKNDRLIGLTVEARKEQGELYSPWAGIWNNYELAYIWASARDLLTRRAVFLDHEVDIYPINLNGQAQETFLRSLLDKTNTIRTRPRFYNTLWSNCTNELAKTAGLGWRPAFVLTGLAPRELHRQRLIAGGPFDELRQAARVTDEIVALNDQPERVFDAELLKVLRARFDRAEDVTTSPQIAGR